MKSNVKTYVIAALMIALSATAWAQQPPGGPDGQGGPGGLGGPPGGGPPQGDVIGENFFPPELIMQHQKEISLTADQRTAISAEMQKVMAKFTDLQWQQSAEQEEMASLVKVERPDEKQVLAELDKLLSIESDIKRIHLASMIHIKNILTADQQTKLRELQQQQMRQRRQSGMGQQQQSRPGGPQGGPPDGPPPARNQPPRSGGGF